MNYLKRKLRGLLYRILQSDFEAMHKSVQELSSANEEDYNILYRLLLNREVESGLIIDTNITKQELIRTLINSEEYASIQQNMLEIEKTKCEKIQHIEERQNGQEERQNSLEGRQNGQEERQNSLEGRQNGQEERQNELKDRIDEVNKLQYANADDYKAYYNQFLKRDPEEGVVNTGVLRNDLYNSILESQEYKSKCGEDIRNLMLVKWELRDYIRRNLPQESMLQCTICGHSHEREKFERKISECIFNGGKLERYICPECGVIFGDEKFTKMTQKEIDMDYQLHYQGYSEGDSTDKEIKAFMALNPDKNKVYLNYGCGAWSHSISTLREDGYNVYGYEPYADASENEYILNNVYACEVKYDGIFSNDLLEHCIDPVNDLKKMRSLLRDSESMMSHSTSCYAYKYEYTRFHTHFFVGDSLNVLANKSGLEVVDFVDKLEEEDFMCCVFRGTSK